MKSNPRRILATATVFGALAALCQAETKTFTGQQSSSWHNDNNWNPAEAPGPNDTAVIPNGLACVIYEDNAACDILQVASAGTLRIESKTLITSAKAHTVNGIIQFKKTGTPKPVLEFLAQSGANYMALGGTGGVLDARWAEGGFGPGVIRNATGTTGGLWLSCEAYGSLEFYVDNGNSPDTTDQFKLDGSAAALIVDDADDTMLIGLQDSGTSKCALIGTGNVIAKAGEIRVGRITVAPYNWTGLIRAEKIGSDRGTVHFMPNSVAHGGSGRLEVDGGIFHIEAHLNTELGSGGFEFTDGTIRVAEDKIVELLH